jgi:hypothetical protein
MRNNRRKPTSAIDGLRLAIDCMPVATREAMLEGLRRNERILVGAYTDEHGGVCPMLAAHRCGGRTDFLSFAKSWDRFARSKGVKRLASGREVRILIDQLEASLEAASGMEFDEAIAEHRALIIRHRPRRRRGPDRGDPSGWIIARRLRRSRGGTSSGDNSAKAPEGRLAEPVPTRG